MITEDYCNFETSKLLKEKGFDEGCDKFYPINGGEVEELTLDELNYHRSKFIKAPTHQMAMKWLREEKYVLIFIVPAKDENGNLTYCADVWTWNDDEGIYEPTWAYANHIYEKAVEEALKYSLENLI